MASAELRDELNCSICLSLYTDPVSLRCGHNFCRLCIVRVLDTQDGSGGYSCPDCRAEYPDRPALEKNRKLGNIVERFSSTQPDMEETGIFCTYCDSPAPAVRTCLQCEASFCEKHLSRHSKSSEHTLVEPTVTPEERKCSTHKETLKYYCSVEKVCICGSCWGAKDHKGHYVEPLDVASEKEKEKLRSAIKILNTQRHEAGRRVQKLKDHKTEEDEKSAGLSERITGLFTDIRKKLEEIEKKIQDEVSRQKDKVSISVCDLVGQVELHMEELTKKINGLEDLCNITDPLTFLQEDLNVGNIKNKRRDVIGDEGNALCLSEVIVSQMIQRGLGHFAYNLKIKRQFSVMEKSDILLDLGTAHNNIIISLDRRSASYTDTSQNRPDRSTKFESCQVLSSRSFSSGRHYWEVDVSQAEKWLIGAAEESIERKVVGKESYIGFNEKSWALFMPGTLLACHNNIRKQLVSDSPVQVVGIYLDYKAGHLSFYKMCAPTRHLHTFTASFTKPLYAAFCVFEDSTIRIIK